MQSVGQLKKGQNFQVLFFARDGFIAWPPGRLAPAGNANEVACEEFLDTVRAAGWSSTPVPALAAGFQALRALPGEQGRRKLLLLLTHGDFSSGTIGNKPNETDNKSVLAWLRTNNADKAVQVYPIVIGDENPGRETEEAMKRLASENGGEYRFIQW
jgi:hypothetical protein